MGRKWLAVWVVLAVGVVGVARGKEKKALVAGEVFGAEKLWEVHLRISPEAWKALEPGRGPRLGMRLGRVPATGPATEPSQQAGKRSVEQEGEKRAPNSFGFEYVYVHGEVEMDGEVYRDVGVRFKGNASYSIASRGTKKPFKIDFNRYVKGQKFHGMPAVILNNNAFDPSEIREAMSYTIYREAGVPAPRTAFAAVYLTVEGKYDREYLGVYTLLEDLGTDFLESRFGSGKGLLLKPERARGLPYLGEAWPAYEERYRPKSDVREKDTRRIIEMTKLIQEGDDETFAKQIGEYLAVEEFVRYLASSLLLLNLDSILITGHNFYLYVNPADKKVYCLPWDMHLSFGGFGSVESDEGKCDLSVMHPYEGENRVIDRLMEIEEVKQRYRELLREFVGTIFRPEKVHAQIEAMERTVSRAEEKAKAAGKKATPATMPTRNVGSFLRQRADLKPIVSKRVESVVAQLDGKTEGYVPGSGISRQWRFFQAFAGRGGPGAAWAVALVKGADQNADRRVSAGEMDEGVRRFFAAADVGKKGWLDERGIAEGLERILPGAEGARAEARGPATRPAPRPVTRPGASGWPLARVIMREADAKRSGRVTVEELLAAERRMFGRADLDKNGALDQREAAETIRRLMGPGR